MVASPDASGAAPPLTTRESKVAVILGFGAFFTNLDVTAVLVALPIMSRDLGFGMAATAWVMDAYSLAFTGMLLAAGTLADRFGRRRALLIGNAIFLAASVACGFAWDGPSLWIARGLQGIGAAFVVTGALALVGAAFVEPAGRARAFALMGVVSGIGMAVGPTLGGLITIWIGWRWIFFANIPFCLYVAILLPKLIGESNAAEARPLDLVGVALLTAAMALLIDATLRMPEDLIMAVRIAAAALAMFVLFGLQQRYQKTPLLDATVFATPAMVGVGLLLISVSVGYWAVLVSLPPAMQSVFEWSSDRIGFALFAATAPMLVMPLIGSGLVTRIGWRLHFTLSLAIIALGDLVLLVSVLPLGAHHALPLMIFGMLAIGIGSALAHPQLSGAVLALAPPDRAGMASAVTIVARQGGFALGIAVIAASKSGSAGHAAAFALGTTVALAGAIAALTLLPPRLPAS